MTYTFKLSRRLASNDWGRGALVAAALLLNACAASPTDPSAGGTTPAVPGWLTVQLTTPYSDDGAVQLRVTGPAVDSIVAESPHDGFGAASAGSADLVVTGTIVTGSVARFRVSDVNKATQYTATVVAAAQRSTFALRSTSGYRTAIVR